MADEQNRIIEFGVQSANELEHFGLDRGIESGGRLIENQQRGIGRQRHGDDDALLHSAR